MSTEVAARADFSKIRYAQCWEDADILLEGLALKPGGHYLSIASAGDNALAMVSRGVAKVVALDMNPAQLSALALRVAAYRSLSHAELLELIGSRPSQRRTSLYERCRPLLQEADRRFWDAHATEIENGIGGAGKFERYFAMFRHRVLPWVHSRKRVQQLLQGGDAASCERFYATHWNNWRWRLMFQVFFSRFVMGRLGRDPSFFKYVEGSVAERILMRTRHALTALNPADNPYLQWILTGQHTTALPFALRAENFQAIRDNLHKLEWHLCSIEEYLAAHPQQKFDGFNLSDIFEYMSVESFHALLDKLLAASNPGARLVYWNMLAPRQAGKQYAERIKFLEQQSQALLLQDKAFFYNKFIVEEVR